jgi:ABC-2 type transport system permease protein
MFRRLFAITRIEFKLEFAYPISFLFFLILPLVFTAAVGAGLGGMMGGGDESPQAFKTVLYVVSEDEGALVDALLETLAENGLVPESVDSLPEDTFGLEIPSDFSSRLRKGEDVTLTLHTLPTTTASQAVEQYVQASVSRLGGAVLVAELGLNQARQAEVQGSEAEERTYFNKILTDTLSASEEPLAKTQLNWAGGIDFDVQRDSPTSAEQASAGQIITWTQITFLAAAEVFVAEREAGTLRRLLITPTSRSLTLGGKLLSRLILGLVQMVILFLGGAIIFGVNWGQSPLALIAVSLAFALATVGLGLLIATFVKSRGQANSVVIGLAMGLSALGGAWYPLEITPPIYRQIVKILPSTWAMQAYTDLLAQNAGFQEVLPAIVVLLLFAAVFIIVGTWRFQKMEM